MLINNPPVNALSQNVRHELLAAVESIESDSDIAAAILAGAGGTFIAGADIAEFDHPPREPHLPDVLARVHACKKPIVAALHGNALGGGLETALACHARLIQSDAHVGCPEVKLGLIPGAGGTQRLPRLAGFAMALDMVSSGRRVPAAEALANGLADRQCEGGVEELLQAARVFARELAQQGEAQPLDAAPLIRTAEIESLLADARARSARRARGQTAPQRVLDALELSLQLPLAEGMAKEREYFLQCRESGQSRAMRHVFFAERAAARPAYRSGSVPTRSIQSVGIIGAGIMGTGIAIAIADQGLSATLLEENEEALQHGMDRIRDHYQAMMKKNRLTEPAYRQRMALLHGSLDYAELSGADLVIEAVFENMEIKKQIFSRLDEVCKPKAILASNTSSLNLDEMAAVTSRPEDLVGLHFFNPAYIMRLLEVVRGAHTAPEVLSTALHFARRLGKQAVVAGVCDGFIGNRMLHHYVYEANRLLIEGARPAQVDAAMREFGFPMGPFQVGDLAGLDVGYSIRKQRRARGVYIDPAAAAVPDRLVELGRLGQKTGSGYYRYQPGSRTPNDDPETEALIEQVATELKQPRRKLEAEEITRRCLYALINQGARVLEEGIAACGGDVDVVWVHGYGFPVYRGGPMYHADHIGLSAIVEELHRLRERHGEHWQAARLLEECAADGTRISAPR